MDTKIGLERDRICRVRFTPKSGHVRRNEGCLLWANSGLMQRSGGDT
jgi:hypothetical protein